MTKSFLIATLGLIVGVSLLTASWALVLGIIWLCHTIFVFLFTRLPCFKTVAMWTIIAIVTIPTILISYFIGVNVVVGYIIKK